MEKPEVFKRLDAGTHKLVFLGDMIDRGPDSFEVVAKIKDMVETGWAIALLGNHDDFALRYHEKRIFDKQNVWFYGGNGGLKTVSSYTKHFQQYGQGHFFNCFERSGHAAWLKSLPLYYETDKVFFSHAPIPHEYLRHQISKREGDFRLDRDLLLWSVAPEGSEEGAWEHDHGKLAVCGHVHALQRNILEPRIFPHIIYADTGSGCAEWGRLTAIIITEGKYDGYIQAIPDAQPQKIS